MSAVGRGSLIARIERGLVTPRPDCQLWPTPDHKGYGRITVDGRHVRIHRLFWEEKNGQIPDGLVIDHLCRVRSCCNTEHMEVVTPAENSRRGVASRGLPDECRQGHPYSGDNLIVNAKGRRYCRACEQTRDRARRRPKREGADST
jgi:hypothetical protein